MVCSTVFSGTGTRVFHPLLFRMLHCSLVLLVLAMAAPVSGAEITISDGTSINMTIQAVANDGDEIILNPGTYSQAGILVNKNITIRANISAGGSAENTIIDGSGSATIMNVSSGISLRMDNLTLQGGESADEGGVMNADHATVNLTSLIISGCHAGTRGGAIYAKYTNLTVVSSTFTGCSAPYGGAINSDNGNLEVTSSVFFDCSATNRGGAIYTYQAGTTITSSTFSDCMATGRGGAIYPSTSTVTVTSSLFRNCFSPGNGGAIYPYDSLLSVTSSTFSGCSAANGGAIYSSLTTSIVSSTFSGCTAGTSGSAVYVSAGTVTITFSRFANNSGTDVHAYSGTVHAPDNWWGTSNDPTASTYGSVTVTPWLVMNITATPSSINTSRTSIIRTNLTKTSAGTDTISGGSFVPDGIPVAFALTSGTGTFVPGAGNISSGANATTFTPADAGTSTVSATIDGETVSADIEVTTPVTTDAVGVYRPSETKFILKNGTESINITFGKSTDTPVSGDWNGDGITDVGVHRAAIQKFVLKNGTVSTIVKWGLTTDTGVAGDWNGDGMGDIGVFRSSLQKFVVKNGTVKTIIKWGQTTDKPVTGDWNGDGLWDAGVFRPSTGQFVLKNGTEKTMITFGESTDLPVAGDWNDDGRWDIGVYRPSTQQFILKNGVETITIAFGESTDLPLAGKWR